MTESKSPAEKKVLRIQVEFWRRDQPGRTLTGYTTDVSASGMFVACHSPFKPGTPVELRIPSEKNLLISGTVARAVKVPMQFRTIMTSGMGIQFDNPTDPAVRELEALGTSIAKEIKY